MLALEEAQERGLPFGRIVQGDAFDFMATLPDCCLDLIATDPPYLSENIWMYEAVAREGRRLLRRGGAFLAIVPHYALADVMHFVGNHLKYRWINCMWQGDGPHARMAMGVEVMWKPVICWVKEAWPKGRGFVRDGFVCPAKEKGAHVWQQAEAWAEYCLKYLPPKGVVLDPFSGAGTLPAVATRLGVNFLACELSPEHAAAGNARVVAAAHEARHANR